MPGLVPGIHGLYVPRQEGVDGRDRPGHDDEQRTWQKTAQLCTVRSVFWPN
jgi:beta-N-acetylhexosaminidase